MDTKKIILLSLLTAVALIISLLEYYIPLPIPNVHIGLSNIVIIVSIVLMSYKDTLLIIIIKSFLLVIILGSPISFIYNFFAGLVSITIMYLFYKYLYKFFSLIGISVMGAVFHIFTQIYIYSILLNTSVIFTFIPILGFISVFTGILVGILSIYILKILRRVYV